MFNKDPYVLLGVGRNASAHEIRRSYRRLAGRYHPDRNKSSDAELRFKEIQWAYSLLSDKVQRAAFNRERQQHGASKDVNPGSAASYGASSMAGFDVFEQFLTYILRFKIFRFIRVLLLICKGIYIILAMPFLLFAEAVKIVFFFVFLPFGYLLHFFAGEPYFQERNESDIPEWLFQRLTFIHPTQAKLHRRNTELYAGRLVRVFLSVVLLVYFFGLIAVGSIIIPSMFGIQHSNEIIKTPSSEAGVFGFALLFFPFAVMALRSKLWYIFYSIIAICVVSAFLLYHYL